MKEREQKKERKNALIRALMNVRGELVLLKREQKRMEEKLEAVLRTHAGLAAMLYNEKLILKEMLDGADRVLDGNGKKDGGLAKAA